MVYVKHCPKCKGQTEVKNSRTKREGIYRRRVCRKCGCTFSTLEIPIEQVKRNNFIEQRGKELARLIEKLIREEIKGGKK